MSQIPTDIENLLALTVKMGASDLHCGSMQPAYVRVHGQLQEVNSQQVPAKIIEKWLLDFLGPELFEEFQDCGDADFAVESKFGERFRVNAYVEQKNITLALRHLRSDIPSFDDLGLPVVPREWSTHQTGLVIITGPTGSGKSTTVASMVNKANQEDAFHILTIEDPVEYIMPAGKSVVRQREIGSDTSDFPRAIRSGLREDIDIMVIGEMRDLETIAAAITVAETGHLVFATLHTNNATQAIDRIIDAFEPSEQPLIRSRLSACLVGVIYQRLIPSIAGGRVAAYEVLVANYAVKNLIREGKTHQIPNTMTTAMGEGMQSMERSLQDLVKAGKIDASVAKSFLSSNIK